MNVNNLSARERVTVTMFGDAVLNAECREKHASASSDGNNHSWGLILWL